MHTGLGELETHTSPHGSLADLDVTLGRLIQEELADVGMSGVQVTFEAPERDRVATWPSPTVNLFLYDIRESGQGLDRSWVRGASDKGAGLSRAPLRLECSFAITAWTRHALDEHRLLAQVLAILLGHPVLPPDRLEQGLRVGDPPAPLGTRIAHGRPEGRADFWSAIGSPYKVALEYSVTVLIDPNQRRARGRPVSAAWVSIHPSAAGAAVGEQSGEMLAQGGTVRDARGDAVAGAWVLVAASGRSAVVSETGEFVVGGLTAGEHEFRVRAPDGAGVSVTATVPGPAVDVVLAT